jgi:hypothetical protein
LSFIFIQKLKPEPSDYKNQLLKLYPNIILMSNTKTRFLEENGFLKTKYKSLAQNAQGFFI